jgi:hypothetical protein
MDSVLPEELLGGGGARVRCPGCELGFVVPRHEMAVSLDRPGSPRAAEPAAPSAAAHIVGDGLPQSLDDPAAVAATLLDRLALRLGPAWSEARARGRMLSEFGPEVLRAYEEYRTRLGEHASALAFRTALRDRWALDLGAGEAAAKD